MLPGDILTLTLWLCVGSARSVVGFAGVLLAIILFVGCGGRSGVVGEARPSCTLDCGECASGLAPSGYFFYDEFEVIPGPWLTEPMYSRRTASQYQSIDYSSGGKALALIVTPTSSGPNARSELASVYVRVGTAHASTLGQEVWYRTRIRFPEGGYFPTTGEWNWHVEWHNDAHTAPGGSGPYSMATGVYTDYPTVVGQEGRNPRLVFRLAGGSQTSPTYEAHEQPPGSLLYDHWYDLRYHFVWHTDASIGLVEWWVDGQLVVSKHFPTLYTNADGTHSYNGFGLYNYRWHDPNHTSEVDFDLAVIGPTRASVGG